MSPLIEKYFYFKGTSLEFVVHTQHSVDGGTMPNCVDDKLLEMASSTSLQGEMNFQQLSFDCEPLPPLFIGTLTEKNG